MIDVDILSNLSDLKILIAIIDKNKPTVGTSEVKGVTIKNLIEKTGYSHMKIRSTIKQFLEQGVVAEGLRNGNSKTYYITRLGLELLKKTKSEKES